LTLPAIDVDYRKMNLAGSLKAEKAERGGTTAM
jgi:hypothetical protein